MSGVQIGSLHVSLSADAAVFDKEMDDAAHKSDSTFDNIKSGAKVMAAALAAAFTVDYMAGAIKKQIDYADSLADVAARTFQTTEQLSAMEYALHFSDATLQDYTDGLQKLSVNMEAVAQGNKQQADLFEAIGIKVKDQDGLLRDSGEVMLEFADRISSMSDGAEKTALVMDILGKSAGPQLLPFLNQGKEAITGLTGEAERLGVVISKEVSDQAGQLNDNLDKMKFAANGAWQTLGNALLPALVDISGQMTSTATNADLLKTAGEGLGLAFKVVYTGVSATFLALEKVGDKMGKLAAVGAAVSSGDLDAAKSIWADTSNEEKYQAQLFSIGNMWTDVGQKAAESAARQDEAAKKAAKSLEAAKAASSGKGPKAKEINKQQEFIDFNSLIDGLLVEQEAASVIAAQQSIANQQQELDAFNASIDEMLVEQDAANVIADQQWSDLVDGEIQRMDEMNTYKLEAHRGLLAGLLTLDQQRISDVVTLGDAELEERKRQMAKTVDFFQQGLASMAQGQGKAAKAARNIQKAEALYQIGVNTYSAAMGAYNALAPIPFIGPALGVAAAGAAIAFGADMAKGVMSGGTPTITGGAPTALPATRDILSQSEQRQQSEMEGGGVTYVRIPEDAIMTGRTLIDLIDNAFANGKKPNYIRFIPT